MKRVLFVDDDRDLLDALRRVLRRDRTRWDMVFVEGPYAALDALAGASFDVVVSDMRMPGMSGHELLARVREEHPHAIRIMLSGNADPGETAIADHYLAKPCNEQTLRVTLARVAG